MVWRQRLRWFGHVESRQWICWTKDLAGGAVGQVEKRPQRRFMGAVKAGVTKVDARNRARWRQIHCGDPLREQLKEEENLQANTAAELNIIVSFSYIDINHYEIIHRGKSTIDCKPS